MMHKMRCIGLFCLVMAFIFIVSGQLAAQTTTFTGFVENGIVSGKDFNCPPTTTLNIFDPTTNIFPSHFRSPPYTVQDPGVWFRHKGANGSNGSNVLGTNGGAGANSLSLTHNFVAPSWSIFGYGRIIFTLGPAGYGIAVESQAGDGGRGGDIYSIIYGAAGDGGRGGNAGAVNVFINTSISGNLSNWIYTEGLGAHGIFALSRGGQGGRGGDSHVVGVAKGGDGGLGGLAGVVSVDATIRIQTLALRSHGILAQSLGGAAGGAGGAGGLWGGGGDAGDSGHGNTVNVTSHGSIETRGADSDGILAQSIGGFAFGGGGGGGLFFYGGSGGSSGNGNTTTVNNHSAIDIRGTGGSAIVAQSIGGGGGRAGKGGGVGSLGATGAAGGDGGSVSVTNSGRLRTYLDDSAGLIAQSIGGGGGTGGGTGGAVVVGGDGGSSGNGGTVSVSNSGAVTTVGINADAIFAHSVGGGGGRAAASGGLLTFGGTGQSGGAGGTVNVANNANLSTHGLSAGGILAQSIGGGGGSGGGVHSGMLFVAFAQGGSSSGGGAGGNVTVTSGLNAATTITTRGDFAHAIHGESTGGGGGSGGNAVVMSAGMGVNMAMSRGGIGGGGGDGGTVNINNKSNLSTQGAKAHGLFAESIGGGGGAGGTAIAKSIAIGLPELPTVSATLSIGGTGGEGGDGKAVTVATTGNISTMGQKSYGVFAQSVGGGGGEGGYSTTNSFTFASMSMTGSIGGSGGDGGSGGNVNVNSSGSIGTQAEYSYGLFAQSVGGGGGAGGNSTMMSFDVPSIEAMVEALITPAMEMQLTVGGVGGQGGSGAGVQLISSGAIATQGVGAHGILAQSVGGGGGAGGSSTDLGLSFIPSIPDMLYAAESIDLSAGITLGGLGMAAGHGAAVNVDNRNSITTEGNFAHGLFAHSVGGGGGSNGLSIKDPFGLLKPSNEPPKINLHGKGHGSGDTVTVRNSGNITTHGASSHGILAQSVGGGGGFAAISDDSGRSMVNVVGYLIGCALQNFDYGAVFLGSAGGQGSANAVSVTSTGSVETFGMTAHGIYAQSAAEHGLAGDISIAVHGRVTAHAADAHAVFAQSLGSLQQGSGNVNITVANSAIIQGGSEAGAAIAIDGNKDNLLTNHGHIAALSNQAIIGGKGNNQIINHGTIAGNVLLGAGNNEFINYGRFNCGSLVALGDENPLLPRNPLHNSGILSPGGPGVVASTTLIGDLIHLPGGTLEIDIAGLLPGLYDVIDIAGALSSAASLKVDFILTDTIDFSMLAPQQSINLRFLRADSGMDLLQWHLGNVSGNPALFEFDLISGPDNWMEVQITNAVPEPGTMLLLLTGLGILTRYRSKRKTSNQRT